MMTGSDRSLDVSLLCFVQQQHNCQGSSLTIWDGSPESLQMPPEALLDCHPGLEMMWNGAASLAFQIDMPHMWLWRWDNHIGKAIHCLLLPAFFKSKTHPLCKEPGDLSFHNCTKDRLSMDSSQTPVKSILLESGSFILTTNLGCWAFDKRHKTRDLSLPQLVTKFQDIMQQGESFEKTAQFCHGNEQRLATTNRLCWGFAQSNLVCIRKWWHCLRMSLTTIMDQIWKLGARMHFLFWRSSWWLLCLEVQTVVSEWWQLQSLLENCGRTGELEKAQSLLQLAGPTLDILLLSSVHNTDTLKNAVNVPITRFGDLLALAPLANRHWCKHLDRRCHQRNGSATDHFWLVQQERGNNGWNAKIEHGLGVFVPNKTTAVVVRKCCNGPCGAVWNCQKTQPQLDMLAWCPVCHLQKKQQFGLSTAATEDKVVIWSDAIFGTPSTSERWPTGMHDFSVFFFCWGENCSAPQLSTFCGNSQRTPALACWLWQKRSALGEHAACGMINWLVDNKKQNFHKIDVNPWIKSFCQKPVCHGSKCLRRSFKLDKFFKLWIINNVMIALQVTLARNNNWITRGTQHHCVVLMAGWWQMMFKQQEASILVMRLILLNSLVIFNVFPPTMQSSCCCMH